VLSCQEVTARASELLDGELGWRERVAMRTHLLLCRHCRRFHRHLRALVHTLGRRREETPPVRPELVERVMTRIDEAR